MITEFLAVRPAKAAVAATVRFSLWFALRCLCFWFCLGLGAQFRSQVRQVTSKQSAVHSPQSSVWGPHSCSVRFGSVRLTVRWDSRVLYIRKHVSLCLGPPVRFVPAGQQI